MWASADLVISKVGSVQGQVVHCIAQEVGNPDALAVEQYRGGPFADWIFPQNLAVLSEFCRRTFCA